MVNGLYPDVFITSSDNLGNIRIKLVCRCYLKKIVRHINSAKLHSSLGKKPTSFRSPHLRKEGECTDIGFCQLSSLFMTVTMTMFTILHFAKNRIIDKNVVLIVMMSSSTMYSSGWSRLHASVVLVPLITKMCDSPYEHT